MKKNKVQKAKVSGLVVSARIGDIKVVAMSEMNARVVALELLNGKPIDRVEDQGEVDTTQPRFNKYKTGAHLYHVFWKETPKADVHVRNAGSIVQFVLVTDEARAWVDENVATEGWQWLGNMTLNVDPRMAGQLAQGMQEAGFTLA